VAALTHNYQLCVDATRRSWRRVDYPSAYHIGGTLICNGTHLLTLSRGGRLGPHCSAAPLHTGDPLDGMPFTALVLDDGAAHAGTAVVDGTPTDVWRALRPAVPNVHPAELLTWYVREDGALVQAQTLIETQPGEPVVTRIAYDYNASGDWSSEVPTDAFTPPPEAKCP